MKKVRGLAVLEFTLIASTLMLVLLAIFAIGHFVFTLQSVNESTRIAARMAAVCQIGDGDIGTFVADNSYMNSVSAANIEIEYLDENANILASPSSEDVRFVRARAVDLDYQFIAILNFLGENGLMTIPPFETTIPNESLGLVPISGESNTDC